MSSFVVTKQFLLFFILKGQSIHQPKPQVWGSEPTKHIALKGRSIISPTHISHRILRHISQETFDIPPEIFFDDDALAG
jgi:hypothetical protein